MVLVCPKCGNEIDKNTVNIAQDVVFCAPCGVVHKLSALVRPEPQAVPEKQPYQTQPQTESPSVEFYGPGEKDLPKKEMKKPSPIRIVLAILLIIFLWIIWFGIISPLLGWQYGGGAIPMLLLSLLTWFIWRKILRIPKKTPFAKFVEHPEEKGELSNEDKK